jgi:DMSO/TMAO reductase YedYZ heme-binding membrane subunit
MAVQSQASATPSTHLPQGWVIVGYAALILLPLFLLELAVVGTGEAGVRQVVRTSAQTSLLLFVTAFSASSLCQLRRTPLTRWLLANRRYIGVSFGVSHYAHLAALIALGFVSPSFVENLNAVTIVGGGMAYVFLTAMVATSFDRTAAALGPLWWGRLHKVGAYYIWGIFFQSYLPRMLITSIAYAPAVVLLVGALSLRLYAGWQARNRRRTT